MAYVILFSLATLIISFLAGALAITKFNIKLKYVSFALPIGILVFFAALQIGYMIIALGIKSVWVYMPGSVLINSLRKLQPSLFYGYTILIAIIIVIFSIVYRKSIKEVIINQFVSKKKLIVALLLFLIFLFVFMNTQINLRLDDLNYYDPFIKQRINSVYDYPDRFYDYQGFYIYLSVLINSIDYLPNLGRFSNALSLAYIEWIPAILTMLSMSLVISDFIDFVKDKISNKYSMWFVWLSTTILIFIDYWYTVYPHFGGTLRRLSIVFIFYFILEQFENKKDYKYLIMLLFGSYIFFSSSAFFLSVFLIYGYILYAMKNNRTGYIKDAAIFYIIPASFLIAYILYLNLGSTLNTIIISTFIIIYLCLLFINFEKLECILNKGFKIIMFGVPILIVISSFILAKQVDYAILAGMGERSFISPVNFFDMVPDLVNFEYTFRFSTVLFNVLFWGLMILAAIRTWKRNNFYSFIVLIIVLTFFNPFVYRFICGFLTSAAYFRITDIFFNIVILGGVFITLANDDNVIIKRISIVIITLLVIIRLTNIEIFKFKAEEDYNRQYRISQKDLTMSQLFDENILQYSDKKINKVASHIYGIQLLTKHDNVMNLLGDRFSYLLVENDEFEKTFARRYPGYELPEADYEKACTLAYEKKLDYVILDAQYNWMLQDGLWACSAVVLESDVYRVLKMDYDYWQSNINLGYVKDYR